MQYNFYNIYQSILNSSKLFGTQACPPGTACGNGYSSILMISMFLMAFWFLMIAPQRKRQKQHEKMISELKTGDYVLTNGGFFGTILQMKDDRCILKLYDDSKLEIHRNFIQSKAESK